MWQNGARASILLVFAVTVGTLLSGPAAKAQNHEVPQEKLLRHLLQLEQKMTPDQRDHLSAGFGNYLAFAHAALDARSARPDDDGSKPPFTLSQTRSTASSASFAELASLLNDPNNMAIDHYCSLSTDQGFSFTDVRETPFSWSPGHLEDIFINPVYMGDYDAVGSDATGANAGFFSTFQIQTNTNPDVFGMRLKF